MVCRRFYKLVILSGFTLPTACAGDRLRPLGEQQLLPSRFNFVLLDSGLQDRLPIGASSDLRMWYMADERRVFVEDIRILSGSFPPDGENGYYASTQAAPVLSAEKGVRIFYIGTGSKVGRLFLDVRKTGGKRRYIYTGVSYNGRAARLVPGLPGIYQLGG